MSRSADLLGQRAAGADPDDRLHVVLARTARWRRSPATAGPCPSPAPRPGSPLPGAGEAEHAAHLGVAGASSRNVSAIHLARSGSPGSRTSARSRRARRRCGCSCREKTRSLSVMRRAAVELPARRAVGARHDRAGVRRTDERGSTSSGPTRRPGSWSAGERLRPVDGQVEWVAPGGRADGLRVLLGERDGAHLSPCSSARRRAGARGVGAACARVLPPLAGTRLDGAPGSSTRPGWPSGTAPPGCPRCGGKLEPRAAATCSRAPRAAVQFPRTDPAVIMLVTYATGRPCGPARPQPGLAARLLLHARRLRRPGGVARAGRGPRGARGGRRRGQRRDLLRQPALAVPVQPDARLLRARATPTEINVDGSEIEDAQWFTREEMRERGRSRRSSPRRRLDQPSLVEAWYGGPLPGRW